MHSSPDQIQEVIASALLMRWLQSNWSASITGVCIGDIEEKVPVFKGTFEVHVKLSEKVECVSVAVEIDTMARQKVLKIDLVEDIKPRYQKLIESGALKLLN